MPVNKLRDLDHRFSNGTISSYELANAVFKYNGLNTYLAFHELAQIHVAKYYRTLGADVELEVQCLIGEIDIASSTALLEVKPIYHSGTVQAALYAIASKRKLYCNQVYIDNIYVAPSISMRITTKPLAPGVVYYELYNDDVERIKNVVAKSMLVATAATTLLLATLTPTPADDAAAQHVYSLVFAQ